MLCTRVNIFWPSLARSEKKQCLEHTPNLVRSRAVEPEPKQFCMARANNFLIVKMDSEIWVPVPQPLVVGPAKLYK